MNEAPTVRCARAESRCPFVQVCQVGAPDHGPKRRAASTTERNRISAYPNNGRLSGGSQPSRPRWWWRADSPILGVVRVPPAMSVVMGEVARVSWGCGRCQPLPLWRSASCLAAWVSSRRPRSGRMPVSAVSVSAGRPAVCGGVGVGEPPVEHDCLAGDGQCLLRAARRLRVAPEAGQGAGEVSAVVTNRLFRALAFHRG
jgi:hypothetical protein